MPDPEAARARMVDQQIARRGVRDPRVLAAMRTVPREAFVPEASVGFAYDDGPLPIGQGQTISQPYIVALMAEAAELAPGDRVLEVGTGSGYAAAVLARLAERVYSIERQPALAEAARERLAQSGFANVELRIGDGSRGWPEAAPFDAILVAAASPSVPDSLRRQLAPGGRLIVPVGTGGRAQRLLRIRRRAEGFAEEELLAVHFVPLIGAEGWAEDGNPGEANPR
jgi:protein-L-isoaspartate(D-aspartate) O-methyltransferase